MTRTTDTPTAGELRDEQAEALAEEIFKAAQERFPRNLQLQHLTLRHLARLAHERADKIEDNA